MTHKICFWDVEKSEQGERDSTPEEDAQRELDLQRVNPHSAHNERILSLLRQVDAKSIRALREGDSARITTLEEEAADLRSQLLGDLS